jgi:hypothetical protein
MPALNLRKYAKQWIAYVLTVALYAASLYFLFYQVQLLEWLIITLVMLFVAHFAAISAKRDRLVIRKSGWLAWILLSWLLLFLTTDYSPVLIILSYVVFHIGLYFFVLAKYAILNNNISPDPWVFSNVGMYLFTAFFTVSYSILMVGIVWRIPFDCQSIAAGYDRVGWLVSSPAEKSWDKIQKFIQDNTESVIQDKKMPAWFFQELADLELRDSIMGEREQINMSICQTLFDNIQSQFQKPWFQTAILLPLFLILSPIIRILLYILSAITTLIIQLFIKTWVYHKRKVMREVEEWY